MQHTWTKRQIQEFWLGLVMNGKVEYGVKFSYAIARNAEHLRRIMIALQKATAPVPKFAEGQRALLDKYGRKDGKGRLVVAEKTGQVFLTDPAAFKRETDALRAETKQDELESEIDGLLDETEEVSIHQVELSALPKTVKPDYLVGILPMIIDSATPVPTVKEKWKLRAFRDALTTIAESECDMAFGLAVARNIALLREALKELDEKVAPLPAFTTGMDELLNEHAQKDADGLPVIIPSLGQVVLANPDEFKAALQVLRVETGQDKHEEANEAVLNETLTVEIFQAPFSSLPETIRPDMLEAILPMVIEDA